MSEHPEEEIKEEVKKEEKLQNIDPLSEEQKGDDFDSDDDYYDPADEEEIANPIYVEDDDDDDDEYKGKLPRMRLEELFPSKEDDKIDDDEEHPHYVNLYKLNKPYIAIYISPSEIKLPETLLPFYDFEAEVGDLELVKDIKNNEAEAIQVLLFVSKVSGKKYVLKRFYHYFDSNTKDEIQRQKIENEFLSKKFNEFGLMKLFSACPYSANPIEFAIILIEKINYIATEFLMDYAGEPLSKFVPFKTSIELFDIVDQIVKALKFLETYRIEHNDIKIENILVDVINNYKIIRIIDFDIGHNQSFTLKTNKGTGIRGYTNGYYAPEVFKAYQKKQNNPENKEDTEISPWKAQIFSFGIVLLHFFGFFPKMDFKDLDSMKESEEKYKVFLTKVEEEYKLITDDKIKTNLLKIIQISLSFDPNERLNARELTRLIENLDKKELLTIEKEYQDIKATRHHVEEEEEQREPTAEELEELKKEQEKQEEEIKQLEETNAKTEKELSDLNENIKKSQDQVDSLDKEIKELEDKEKAADQEIDQLTKEIELKTVEIETQKVKGEEELKNLQIESEKKIKSMNEEYEMNKIEHEKNLEEIKKLDEEIKNQEKELESLKPYEEKYQILEAKFKEVKEQIVKEGIIDVSKCQDFAELIDLLYKKYCELNEENKKREDEIASLEEELKQVKAKYVEDSPDYFQDQKYTGFLSEGKPHGIGMVEYKNGYKYQCEFTKGEKCIIGIMYEPDGTVFLGRVENDVYEGAGIRYVRYDLYEGAEYYVGEFHNGKETGDAQYYYVNGDVFEGEWLEGKKEGPGKMTYQNGDSFEGIYRNNLRNGSGKETLANQEVYEGDWVNDKKEGKFILTRGESQIEQQYREGNLVN